jgi:two-component system, cell cycle sensor histidine kinase and response regulator CckA
MRRFLKIPNDPLARFRLLSVWFAVTVALLNVGLFALLSTSSPQTRWAAAGASGLLAAWWYYGYRARGFPIAGWLVDMLLLSAVTALSLMPSHAIGLFFASIQFRALYTPRRQLWLLVATYTVARFASIVLEPNALPFGAAFGTAFLQAFGLAVIATTLHLLVSATERHGDMARKLERSDERYRLIARATRDVVYDWNVATGTIEWTESMQNVFGYAPEQSSTNPAWWFERVHPADREPLERSVMAAITDPKKSVDTVHYRVRRADDSYAYVSGSMIVLRAPNGSAHRVIGSIRDVTSEQLLEDQLRQAQKMEAVGQLAGGVAHDFNNLLTVIGGHVFMLEVNTDRHPIVDKHLAGITTAADRAAALTKQLLAFSRRQLLTPTVLNVNAVLDDALQMMRPVLGEQIHIVARPEPSLSPVFADAGQLTQVLVNLALNARDAMPGGGTLTVATENTTIDARSDDAPATLAPGNYIKLTIGDTGSGMDAETLARAFEPFFTTKPHGQGSGLGLATAYGIVKQSFGDIEARSAPGTGSTFTIHLPVAPVAHLPAATDGRGAPSLTIERRGSRDRAVLLVEDDDGVRDFAREVLVRAGYHVRLARNGVDGLEQMRIHQDSIDVVVTDIVMPEMGGREMVEQLRRRCPQLPVLYITGYNDDAQMLEELCTTDARLLEKPFTAIALAEAVADVSEIRGRPIARAS